MKHLGTVGSMNLGASATEYLGGIFRSEFVESIPVVEFEEGALLPCGRDGRPLCFVLLQGDVVAMSISTGALQAAIRLGQPIGEIDTLFGSVPTIVTRTTTTSRFLVLDRDRLIHLSMSSAEFAQKMVHRSLVNSRGVANTIELPVDLAPLAAAGDAEASNGYIKTFSSAERALAACLSGQIGSPHAPVNATGITAEIAVAARIFRASLRPPDRYWISDAGSVQMVLPATTETSAHILGKRLADRLAREVVHDSMKVPMPHISFKVWSITHGDVDTKGEA